MSARISKEPEPTTVSVDHVCRAGTLKRDDQCRQTGGKGRATEEIGEAHDFVGVRFGGYIHRYEVRKRSSLVVEHHHPNLAAERALEHGLKEGHELFVGRERMVADIVEVWSWHFLSVIEAGGARGVRWERVEGAPSG